MTRAVIFGGASEGRELCQLCAETGLPILYCVASAEGARAVARLPGIEVRVGRLQAAAMAALLREYAPELVIDATHPYAAEASANIALACEMARLPLLCVKREGGEAAGCRYFSTLAEIVSWLETEPGQVFVTLGSSAAQAFSTLTDYRQRVWLRILPGLESLSACLGWGYAPERLICMQGPFSQELNRAMFAATGAHILVTKNSGAAGGFSEKVRAAQSLGLNIAVLTPPEQAAGISIEQAATRLTELRR